MAGDDREEDADGDAPPRRSSFIAPPPSGATADPLRLSALRPSSLPPPPEDDQVRIVADVLLAVAHADGAPRARTRAAIARILSRLTEGGEIPMGVDRHISTFEARHVDFLTAARRLGDLYPPQRADVIELSRAICDPDHPFPREEEHLLLGLLLALALFDDDVARLAVRPASALESGSKRALDVSVALAGLAIGWPVFAAVAAASVLGSRGPALLRERASAPDGTTFLLFRFPRVAPGARGPLGAAVLGAVDALVSRTGLAVLPQLLNVLSGELSLVGPAAPGAPAPDETVERIEALLRSHPVKPGLTSWAKVHPPRRLAGELPAAVDRATHDLAYLRRYHVGLDVGILLRAVLRPVLGRR